MTKWVLTPSLRVATFSHLNKLGEEVLVETDLQTKLCRHGETGSTIRTWLQAEARALADGKDPPARNSICDCIHGHGLQNKTSTRPSTPPASVYDVLVSGEAKPLDIGEPEPAYQLGDRDVFLAASGTLYCSAHKHPLPPLTRAVRPCVFKAEIGKCKCEIRLPKRTPKMSLGRCFPQKPA